MFFWYSRRVDVKICFSEYKNAMLYQDIVLVPILASRWDNSGGYLGGELAPLGESVQGQPGEMRWHQNRAELPSLLP